MDSLVLLIDDDKISNFITEATLLRLGVTREIQISLNGKEALDLINKNIKADRVPDIILLDLNMPIMDGFDFILAFQQLDFPDKNKVMIVVLTSSENEEDILKIKRMGIRHYLTKPLCENKLMDIIREHH